ncbi:putative cinnamoyl-CoA reductase [Rhizodiscina lignyota]|uniref:Cinnamoyl-CoA reductase n=1 Tax=Rhizodiscina lignyota TaxID=1504668 RepID=A0A9P4M192_9PEZI|nr:putative cinnamoyl-CoA reductase [Rhizodiscina lignyota]
MASDKEIVLVTGASGFLANEIVRAFLNASYRVRGTVRSKETADKVRNEFPGVSESDLSFAFVPDIAAEGALDEAVKGVSGVIHTAAPVFYGTNHFDEKQLEPAVLGTRNALKSIKQYGSNVKAVVITSSFAAIEDFSKGPRPGYVYTEKDWFPATIEHAKENPGIGYALSKKIPEQEAWAWYEQEKPSWKLSAMCPPFIYGPVSTLQPLSRLNQSSGDVYNLMFGKMKEVPPTIMPSFVDVRDAAETHLKAFQKQAEGRFIPAGGKYLFATICEILAKNFSEKADVIPKPTAEQLNLETFTVDNSRAVKELGMNFRSLEECIVDAGRTYLQLH